MGILDMSAPTTVLKHADKKFSFRGFDQVQMIGKNMDEIKQLYRSRQRRKLNRMTENNPSYHKKFLKFLKKLEVNRSKVVNLSDKPKAVKTHMRDLVVVPKMIGSVDIKNNVIGYYLGEFAMTYRRVCHGKPGVGV